MLHSYSSILWDGVSLKSNSIFLRLKNDFFFRFIGILCVYLDCGDVLQCGLEREMDFAKQLHLDHFRSHGNFIDSKKTKKRKNY